MEIDERITGSDVIRRYQIVRRTLIDWLNAGLEAEDPVRRERILIQPDSFYELQRPDVSPWVCECQYPQPFSRSPYTLRYEEYVEAIEGGIDILIFKVSDIEKFRKEHGLSPGHLSALPHGEPNQIYPRAPTQAEEAKTLPRENIFIREGQYWSVVFQGESGWLQDSLQIRAIAHLLAQQGQRISASELSAAIDKTTSGIMTEAEALAQGLTVATPGKMEASGSINQALMKKAREAVNNVAEAKRAGDPLLIKEAEETAQNLMKEWQRTSDAKTTRIERQRKRTSNLLNRGIERIERAGCSQLAGHLTQFINTGAICSYSPTDSVEWFVKM